MTKTLWLVPLVLAASVACGQQGGVLFYARFDGTRDAQAVGDGQARLIGAGGALTADGFGIRGAALRSGDGVGYLEFAAPGNILPDEGTIEFWLKPEDWSSDDGYYHQYIDVIGQGNIRFQKRADAVNVFWIKAPQAPPPGHFDDEYPGMTMRGYACQQLKDKWKHFFLVWRIGEPLRYYRGGPEGKGVHDSSNPAEPPAPPLGKLTTIRIGDFGGGDRPQWAQQPALSGPAEATTTHLNNGPLPVLTTGST